MQPKGEREHMDTRGQAELTDMPALYDMHCHLDFCRDVTGTARELAKRQVAGGLCCMVTPEVYDEVAAELAGDQWLVGVGLHPWWIERAGEAGVATTCDLLAQGPCLVGEIGLDFGTAHLPSKDAQLAALRRIANTIQPGSILSLHGIKSVDAILNILDDAGVLASCICIMHWFSASSPELTRAVRTGCLFSIGKLMLASKRGREYARQLPAERLLLETDFPPQNNATDAIVVAQSMSDALHQALVQLAHIRKVEPTLLAEHISKRSQQLIATLR